MEQTTVNILTVGLPTIAVLLGVLRLDSRISSVEQSLRGEIINLRSDSNTSFASLRAEVLSSRQQGHDESMLLLGNTHDLDVRLTRIESRS